MYRNILATSLILLVVVVIGYISTRTVAPAVVPNHTSKFDIEDNTAPPSPLTQTSPKNQLSDTKPAQDEVKVAQATQSLPVDTSILNKLVSENQSYLMASNINQVLAANNYSELMDVTADGIDLNGTTIDYQKHITDYLLAQDNTSLLSDYRIACNNQFCLASFSSYDKNALTQLQQQLTDAKSTPLNASKVITDYQLTHSDNESELRMIFNSNPAIQGMVLPSSTASR